MVVRPEEDNFMNEERDAIIAELEKLGSSLSEIGEHLGHADRELAEARSQLGPQLQAVQTFLADHAAVLLGPSPSAGPELSQINEAIQRLVLGKDQEQILETFLEETERHVDRAILFLQKDDAYSPWKSLGFPSASIESVEASSAEDPIVRAVRQQRILSRGEGVGEAFPWLGQAGGLPQAAVCIPLVFGESVPVVFYGDAERGIPLDSLELLSHVTSLVLKNNYLQTLLQAPVTAAVTGAAATREETVPAAEVPGVLPSIPEPEMAPPEVSPAAEELEQRSPWQPEEAAAEISHLEWDVEAPAEAEGEPEPQPAGEFSLEAEAEPEPAETAGFAPLGLEEPLAPAIEEEPPAEAPVEAAAAPPAEKPAPAEEPAAPAEEPAAPAEEPAAATPAEGERYHSEARRFARLLVSEIKLYNEEAVERGRQQNDLYQRLRVDIDRSRSMYAKRVHPTVRSSVDHFHEELVSVLADGKEGCMGPGYPGLQLS